MIKQLTVMTCLISVSFLMTACGSAEVKKGTVKQIAIQTSKPRKMTFESRLFLAGNVSAVNFAGVCPKIPGTLDNVFVDEGEHVTAGKTALFQVDSVKLEEAATAARQQLAVAECSVNEKKASYEMTKVAFDQAERDLARYKKLLSEKAVSENAYEMQESNFKKLSAQLKHAQILIGLSECQLEQAKCSLAIAEKDLSDSKVLAPISGMISARMKEPGENAGAGKPVLEITDTSLIEISAFVPQEYYNKVSVGKSLMKIVLNGNELGEITITYKSPTISATLRTFEIRGQVDFSRMNLVPGNLVRVVLVTERREGLGIPSGTVVVRNEKNCVFAVDSGKARLVAIDPGLENDGWTEVLSGKIAENDAVVCKGQNMLDEGDAVRVIGEVN